MKKLLYIDLPFEGLRGGDKNRSKFIWKALTANYTCDLLLIKPWNETAAPKPHAGCNKQFMVTTRKPRFFEAQSVFWFDEDQQRYVADILSQQQYDVVFIRFASPGALADIVFHALPQARIVIDVDMVFSRLAQLSWQTSPTLKNRFYFIEHKRLQRFERSLFRKHYTFLFTNDVERDLVMQWYLDAPRPEHFCILPNVMQASDYPLPEHKKAEILFFGTLNSAANSDAFFFLADEIYPCIKADLKALNYRVRIVGKNPPQSIQDRMQRGDLEMIDLVGEVDDIDAEIAAASFVVLPIRIASGTRTRILEAANLKTAVISTTIGAEGFAFSPQEIIIKDEAKTFAQAMLELMQDASRAAELGAKLLAKSHQLYLDDVVARNLIATIEGGSACTYSG